MAENLKQTLGYFNVVGTISVDSKCFAMNTPSKNNANWIMNTFNPRVDGDNGEGLYMRFSDGYDKVKGKTIFAQSTTDTNLEIPFADRNNPNMIKLVNDKSFIRVGIGKKTEKNEKGQEYKIWDYKKFLTLFDAITFLNQVMPLASKNKVRITGRIKFSEYKGETQRNFELQSIYLLNNNEEPDKIASSEFTFTQNILVDETSINRDKWDTEGVATINSKLYVKKKKDVYQVLPLELTVRADTEDKKAKYEKVLNKYLTAKEGKIRRVNIEGIFNSGYVAGKVTEEDLPQEAKDLIEDGIYSKEEVMNLYANKDKVDEMLLKRPVVKKGEDGKILVDMDDEEFKPEDLENLETILPQETTEIIEDTQVTDDLLSELEGL